MIERFSKDLVGKWVKFESPVDVTTLSLRGKTIYFKVIRVERASEHKDKFWLYCDQRSKDLQKIPIWIGAMRNDLCTLLPPAQSHKLELERMLASF